MSEARRVSFRNVLRTTEHAVKNFRRVVGVIFLGHARKVTKSVYRELFFAPSLRVLNPGASERTHRVTHLEDIVKAQYHPPMRSETILINHWPYHHLHHCRSFIRFRCQSSLHQSPIRIKATTVKR